MNGEQKSFIEDIAERCETHGDWLMLMEFGLATLLKEQQLFIALVFTEANYEVTRGEMSETSVVVLRILEELNLKIVMQPTAPDALETP